MPLAAFLSGLSVASEGGLVAGGCLAASCRGRLWTAGMFQVAPQRSSPSTRWLGFCGLVTSACWGDHASCGFVLTYGVLIVSAHEMAFLACNAKYVQLGFPTQHVP